MSTPSLTPLLRGADGRRAPAIDRAVLEAAANWYVLKKDEAGFDDAALERWIAASDAHGRAWDLVQQLDRHLGSVPAGLARPALEGAQRQRRSALKVLALLLTAGTGGWAAHDIVGSAAYSTAPGERRTITLADGGTLELNTDTALDIHYDDMRRLIRLQRGEILVRTAADRRRFIVDTPQGSIRALGTRFSVRSDGERTSVAVFEHAVEVSPVDMADGPLRVEAGQHAGFTARTVAAPSPLSRSHDAWTRGMLVAVDQRMDAFLAELGRYRRGHVQCDPVIAALRVTGAYRLDDIDGVLDSLAASHRIRVRHFTRYWVRVAPLD